MPTFDPGPAAASGLDLLAAAAASTTAPPLVPPKVVRKILELEFVEMTEISMEDEALHVPGRPPAPGLLPITDSRTVLPYGSCPGCEIPEQGPGAVSIPHHHPSGREKL